MVGMITALEGDSPNSVPSVGEGRHKGGDKQLAWKEPDVSTDSDLGSLQGEWHGRGSERVA